MRTTDALGSHIEVNDEDWFWCLHCLRFFQAKDFKTDCNKKKQRCPFSDCNGMGISFDIYPWNKPMSGDPCDPDNPPKEHLHHWPKSVSELHKGLKCELYPPKELKTCPRCEKTED